MHISQFDLAIQPGARISRKDVIGNPDAKRKSTLASPHNIQPFARAVTLLTFSLIFSATADGEVKTDIHPIPLRTAIEKYQYAKILEQNSMSLTAAFHWTVGAISGFLIFATNDPSSGTGECVILTGAGRELNIIGSSKNHFQCKWSTDIPTFFMRDNDTFLKAPYSIDATGDQIQFIKSGLDLFFYPTGKVFCETDDFSNNTSPCRKY